MEFGLNLCASWLVLQYFQTSAAWSAYRRSMIVDIKHVDNQVRVNHHGVTSLVDGGHPQPVDAARGSGHSASERHGAGQLVHSEDVAVPGGRLPAKAVPHGAIDSRVHVDGTHLGQCQEHRCNKHWREKIKKTLKTRFISKNKRL